MRTVSRHSGIEVLGFEECKKLLAQDVIGRLAVVIGATPMIFPVNYTLDNNSILVRTMAGSRLDVGVGVAAFEVDSFDRSKQSGWSVLATGHLEELPPAEVEEMERLQPVTSWAPGDRDVWLRLERPSSPAASCEAARSRDQANSLEMCGRRGYSATSPQVSSAGECSSILSTPMRLLPGCQSCVDLRHGGRRSQRHHGRRSRRGALVVAREPGRLPGVVGRVRAGRSAARGKGPAIAETTSRDGSSALLTGRRPQAVQSGGTRIIHRCPSGSAT